MSHTKNYVTALNIYMKPMHIVTRWHFLQAFPSPTSFSFHSNQEDSIYFHSPSMLLKTRVDQLRHLTASTWQADILSSWVWCVFVLVSRVSWIKFQTFFRLVFTCQKDEGSSSQLPAYSKMLSIKIFNCSKQITAKLRLRSMLQISQKTTENYQHRSAIGPNACILFSKYCARRIRAIFS